MPKPWWKNMPDNAAQEKLLGGLIKAAQNGVVDGDDLMGVARMVNDIMTAEKDVDAAPTGVPAHGEGGLFSTPGMGGASEKKRKRQERRLRGQVSVFKDLAGNWRWVLFSSTAYRDLEGEIVSRKSIMNDINRSEKDGDFGPLRWWHMPGVDIGDCDWRALHGTVLLESGTFRDPQVAKAVKANAKSLQCSIGFYHPPSEPDGEGVFHNIRTYERSLVPAGRAANPFTKLFVGRS